MTSPQSPHFPFKNKIKRGTFNLNLTLTLICVVLGGQKNRYHSDKNKGYVLGIYIHPTTPTL